MNITAMMVAFLLHLQSEHDLTPMKTKEILKSPRIIHHLIFQWADFTQWDLYLHMRDALEQLQQITKQKEINNGSMERIRRRRLRPATGKASSPKHHLALTQNL